jgi:CO/xanthine dehydrogenase FAD-binding subunit
MACAPLEDVALMKPAPFTYVRPESVEELCGILARHGEDARILAGGQSLGAMLNMRLMAPSVVADINRVPGLDRVEVEDGHVILTGVVRTALDKRRADLLARSLGAAGVDNRLRVAEESPNPRRVA